MQESFAYLGHPVTISEWDFRGAPVYRVTINGYDLSGRYSCIDDAEFAAKSRIRSQVLRQYVAGAGQFLFQMTGRWVRTGERQIALYPAGRSDWFYTSTGNF